MFQFEKPREATVHNNINVIGTPILIKFPQILIAIGNAIAVGYEKEDGRNSPPDPSDWK